MPFFALLLVRKEFEEIRPLGMGGFGTVFLVRNKLDGHLYAIKKLKLDTKFNKNPQKTLKEVLVLSNLFHDNIVRYYNVGEL